MNRRELAALDFAQARSRISSAGQRRIRSCEHSHFLPAVDKINSSAQRTLRRHRIRSDKQIATMLGNVGRRPGILRFGLVLDVLWSQDV